MTDAERDAVGRAAHEAWKGWAVRSGYADHPWKSISKGVCTSPVCFKGPAAHHRDMVPWDDLPEEKRGKYIETGMAGYALAEADLAALRAELAREKAYYVDEVRPYVNDLVDERAALRARVEALAGAISGIFAIEDELTFPEYQDLPHGGPVYVAWCRASAALAGGTAEKESAGTWRDLPPETLERARADRTLERIPVIHDDATHEAMVALEEAESAEALTLNREEVEILMLWDPTVVGSKEDALRARIAGWLEGAK